VRNERPWLYCAGKISPCDWRNGLFNTRDIGYDDDGRGWSVFNEPPRFRGLGSGGDHPDWRYAGPFFIGCDHSCGHGPATHGCATNEPEDDQLFFGGTGACGGCISSGQGAPSRYEVLEASLAGIRAADVVFVWIDHDFATAHGTMSEIGYAAALGKPIYSARSPAAAKTNLVEAWFPLSLTRFMGTGDEPGLVLPQVLSDCRRLQRWRA
jgi:Nucleoside 2-deoxyribosyltransferase